MFGSDENLGGWGERAAARYAEARGARVLARNWRGRRGELDLVLEHRGVLVFAEVKTRRAGRRVGGLEAVTPLKQRRVARAALEFLARTGRDPGEVACRFDVFLVHPGPEVTWLEAAFGLPD